MNLVSTLKYKKCIFFVYIFNYKIICDFEKIRQILTSTTHKHYFIFTFSFYFLTAVKTQKHVKYCYF